MSKSLLSRSVWESLFSRLSGSRKLSRRRRSQDRRWNNGVAAESLENRIVPAVTALFSAGTLELVGQNSTSEAVTVRAGSSYTDVLVNGVFTARLNNATSNSISTITFDGGTSAGDTLSISGTNQAIAVTLKDVETLSLTSTRDAVVLANEPLQLGTSTVSGTLSVTTNSTLTGFGATTAANTGDITQTGKLIVSGLTTLDANSATAGPVLVNNGGSITLTNSGNSFGTVELSGLNITVTEAGATDIGTTTAGGTLTVTSRGAITDSGVLAVTGDATFTSVGNAITLDDPTSTFGDDIFLSGTDVAVTDNSVIKLGTTTATGTLSVTSKASAQSITGTGAIKVGGLATFTTTGNGAVDLDDTTLTNNFGSISVSAGTGQVDIREKSATTLAGITSGVLNVTSNGAITDSSDVKPSGNTNLTTTGGAITIDEGGSTFGGTLALSGKNIDVTDNDGTGVTLASVTANGTLTITSTNGAIADAGNISVTGRATFNAGTGTITLNSGVTNFGSLSLNGASATVQEDSATDLFTSTLTTGGLTLDSAGAVTDSGDLTIAGVTDVDAGTGKNVTLDSSGNALSGAINSSGKRIVINNTLGTILGDITATGVGAAGSLTITSGGDISDSATAADNIIVPGRATFTATGNDITLDHTSVANEFGSLAVEGANVDIHENDTVSTNTGSSTDLFSVEATGTFSITSGGAITDSGTVTVGGNTTLSAATFDITLDSAASTFGGDLLLTGANVSVKDSDAGGVNLGASTVTGNLTINAGGDITDSGSTSNTVNIGTGSTAVTATLNAGSGGNITLDATRYNTSGTKTLSLTGEDAVITLNTASAVELGTVTLTGLLSLTAGGNVSDSGTVSVAGTTTINPGANTNSVILNSAGNSFTGTITITDGSGVTTTDASDVTINNTTATDLGASAIAGNLTITSSGAITDSGVIAVGGTTTLTASGSAITFDTSTSTFTGTLTLSGSDISVIDNDGVTVLGTTTATGSLTVSTTGSAGASGNTITQSGVLNVGGAASFSNTSTATTSTPDVTLTTSGNKFGSIGVTAGRDVSITEANATNLAATNISGTLTVVSGGAVTDSGTLTVTGAVDINANSNNADITLDSTASTFGALTLKGVNVAVTENAASVLASVIANNTFSLTTLTGGVTQTGNLTVAGLATITATSQVVTLDEAPSGTSPFASTLTNNFGSISVTGSSVTLRESGSTNLAGLTATGTFSLVSKGAVTDSGTLTVGDTTTIVAGNTPVTPTTTYDITLDSSANSFTGGLFLTGKHIAITNDRATVLGDNTATGAFTLISNGAVTEDDDGAGASTTAQQTITGTFTIDASAGAFNITIDEGSAAGTTDNDTFTTQPLVLIVSAGGTASFTPKVN